MSLALFTHSIETNGNKYLWISAFGMQNFSLFKLSFYIKFQIYELLNLFNLLNAWFKYLLLLHLHTKIYSIDIVPTYFVTFDFIDKFFLQIICLSEKYIHILSTL